MKNLTWRTVCVIICSMVMGASLVSCGGKFTEPFKDAAVSERNSGPARVGTMPDGFNNWAAKCDGPNMVYTLYHSDGAYGSLTVVPNDPRCGGR